MKYLVTGFNGQLGYDVVHELQKNPTNIVVGIDIQELDITNENEVDKYITNFNPDVIVHCAAYTQVDKAEENEQLVNSVNALGTMYIAKVAKKIGSKLIYFSTDYVFEGVGEKEYLVNDETNPIGVYGRTKLNGEICVKELLNEYFIIRISWVFGINGNNFIKTMLRLAETKKELSVVSDQIGSPTYTYDLAKLVVDMCSTDKYGTYHATNEGTCSWAEFARYIFKVANKDVIVNDISTAEYQKLVKQARRPLNSRMDKSSLLDNGFTKLPKWEDAVIRYIDILSKGDN